MASRKFWKAIAGTSILVGVALAFAAPAAAPVGILAIYALLGAGVIIATLGTSYLAWVLLHQPQGEQAPLLTRQEV